MAAAIPSSLVEKANRSSTDIKGPTSHGRGGAGNMGTSVTDFDSPSLETPTLKGEVYTTGRGGSGNMAKNTDPDAARRAQDVTIHPRRESGGSTHVGRGGAANIFHTSLAGLNQNGSHEYAIDSTSDDHYAAARRAEAKEADRKASKGLADRGKEWLMGKR